MASEIEWKAFEKASEELEQAYCEGCRFYERSIDSEPYGERMVPRVSVNCSANFPEDCQAVDFYIDEIEEDEE